jgi:hypothetical protein
MAQAQNRLHRNKLHQDRLHGRFQSGRRQNGTILAARRIFGCRRAFALSIGVASLALLGLAACNSSSSNAGTEKAAAAPTTPAASPAPAPKLSAAELKEVQARDDYATQLSKSLHAKMPAYKNVKIYADSWAGTKAPGHAPLADIKVRASDNLMLVFWSPDPDTARGLTDFTKSRAAQDAVNTGFAEFQFVDPGTYCYANVAPVGGVSPAVCGIR